jgi:hypothetical protein
MKRLRLRNILALLALSACFLTTLHADNNMIAHAEKLIGTTSTTNTSFGNDVDADGDWMIAASMTDNSNTGKVWFYERQSDGTYVEDSYFVGSGSSAGDYFGISASISGDFAVVGAIHANSSQGEAYVYYNHPSTGWGEFQILTDPTGAANHYFGTTVSISGDRIVVGAYGNDDNKTDGGTVLVYQYNGTSWVLETELYPTGTYNESALGYFVAIDGERISASAPDFANNTPGAVFVWDYDSGTTSWTQSAKLTPSSDQGNGTRLGYNLSMDGDTVAASVFAVNNTGRTGRVFVYTLQKDGSWLNETILLPNQYAFGDAFGSLGLDANDGLIAVGSYQKAYPGSEQGECYLFARSAQGFWEQVYVGRTDRDTYDRLGNAVAITASNMLVGAIGDDDWAVNSGAVYNYILPDNAYSVSGGGSGSSAWTETTTAVHTSKDVGIDTSTPDAKLHVYSNDDATDLAQIIIENEDVNTTINDRELLVLKNYGGSRIDMINTNNNRTWRIGTPNNYDRMNFHLVGTGVSEMAIDINGNLAVHNDITAGGTVTWSSDRNIKENFEPVNHHDVLAKVADMEITKWNYIRDEDDTTHIGPMAQDFYAAFGVGKNEKTISSTDVNGVAIASIKALKEQLDDKDAKIGELETKLEKMEDLEQKLEKMEALLEKLMDK